MNMKTELILFRGIAVKQSDLKRIINKIKNVGLVGNEGFWKFTGWELRKEIDNLLKKKDLTVKDTREGFREFPVISFADEMGAHYYALHHNYKEGHVPLVIKIKVDLTSKYVYVDGRDFLYPVFQGWDQRNLARQYGIQAAYMKVIEVIKQIYGEKIEKYFKKASQVKDQSYRIAMCDLATHDLDIVRAYADNELVIEGRYNVIFKSAFFVEAPITPDEIVDIFIPNANTFQFKPRIKIYEWL